jgi:hypothetical protein
MMRKMILAATTNGSGAATVTGERAVIGKLYAIEYQPGTLDTGATITLTCENGVYSKPLLTKATAGTSATMFYPRDLVHAVADGTALTGTSGGDRCQPLMSGTPKLVVASGGAVASGKVILYFEE